MDIALGFANADITVEKSTGSRGADGYTESATETVISGRADYQQGSRRAQERIAFYDAGDAVVFCGPGVTPVRVGQSVTVDHDDGRTTEGVVEEVMHDEDALLVSHDA